MMRRLPFALAASLALMLAGSAATGREEGRQSLTAFADAFDRAQLEKDGAALDRMIADDLVFIDGSGKRLDKRAFIAGWTGAEDRYDPITLVDRVVIPLGLDAGIANAETVLTGVSDGKRFSSHFRFADIFHWRNGRWQAVHIQVTRMP